MIVLCMWILGQRGDGEGISAPPHTFSVIPPSPSMEGRGFQGLMRCIQEDPESLTDVEHFSGFAMSKA